MHLNKACVVPDLIIVCLPTGLVPLKPTDVANPTLAINASPGSRSAFGSSPVLGSKQRWTLKSIKGPNLGAPGSSLSSSSSSGEHIYEGSEPPMEAKAAALEMVAMPASRDGVSENYSGEGREHGEEGHPLPQGPPAGSVLGRTASEEDADTEGSTDKDPLDAFGDQLKVATFSDTNSAKNHPVVLQSTVQWELVHLPTVPPSHGRGSPEAKLQETSEEIENNPEEARGEILFVRRPAEKLRPTSSAGKDGTPFVRRKQNFAKGSVSQRTTPLPTTTACSSTTMTPTLPPTTEFTPEPAITLLPVEQDEPIQTSEPQAQLSTTAPSRLGLQTTSGSPQLTTSPPGARDKTKISDYRTPVSESFVVARGWRTLPGLNFLPVEHRSTQVTRNSTAESSDKVVANQGYESPSGKFTLLPPSLHPSTAESHPLNPPSFFSVCKSRSACDLSAEHYIPAKVRGS